MEKSETKKDHSSKPSPDGRERRGEKRAGEREGIPTFLRFTGIAFEMLATIGVATLAGFYIDKYLTLKFPVFLLSLSMLSLLGSLYLLYKRLPKDK